jgi:multidrug efflux pump subunit AcrB
MGQLVAQKKLAGIRVRIRTQGIRGVRVSQGNDEVSLRIQGQDLGILTSLADEAVKRLSTLPQLLNLEHSLEEIRQELTFSIDRQRAAALDLTAEQIGRALQLALDGEVVTEYLEGDRAYDIRLRLPRSEVGSPLALEQVILFDDKSRQPLRLRDVASIKLMAAPAEITRENQRRIVEITATLTENTTLGEIQGEILRQLEGLQMPIGYLLYDGGEYKTIQQSQQMGYLLLALALFLVFVVMAVQYESLRNPLVILLTVPFAVIGVALGLRISGLPISMPVWLGMIMLAGIVVNNAIVLVEYIEIARRRGMQIQQAIIEAARLRLRPILMTTLTTVAGMIPLAIGVGEGAEMLQPLALTLIAGLSMSLIVTLLQIPITYNLLVRN